MSAASDAMVDVGGVPTFVRRIGRGPPVVVVHGGPGFDHRYVEPIVQSLSDRRTLILFDQPGTGRSPVSGTVTADMIFRHFASLVDDVLGRGPLGIIAHSWGVLVALGAKAKGMSRSRFDEGLLVTPVPVDRPRYDAASRNLFARFSPEVERRYGELAAKGAHGEIVELLLPHYFAKPIPVADVGLNVEIATFLSVTASLGDFDFGEELGLFDHCVALTTDSDISTPGLLGDLLSAVVRRYDLAGVGHFPGHEAPKEFQRILREVFA